MVASAKAFIAGVVAGTAVTAVAVGAPAAAAHPDPQTTQAKYSIKIALENDHVRVRDVTFPPGVMDTGMHTHEYPHVGVILTPGSLTFTEPGKPTETTRFETGSVGFREAHVTHQAANPGKSPMRVIEVELKSASGQAQTPTPDRASLAATGILERLAERTGVYGVPPTAKTPGFIADAGWPQKLPNNWIIGQVGGLYVAPDDHIWIYQRPRSLTSDEAALTDATHKDKDGKPVDVLGFARPYGVLGDCCVPAPSVMEFDASGKLLRAWGGPADPGKCRMEDGCVWPASEHGIFVDHNGFVYVGGSSANATPNGSAWASTNGADGMILKFTKDGKFVMMIGGHGAKGPDSNNTDGGRNRTPLFYLPADITVDPSTNRMYVSDGYGNRRVVIVDAATGKYIGHFGAYGNNPIDDQAAAAAGIWMNDFTKKNMKPAFFRNPVHCAKIAKDGLLYVCDRGNNRVQVFNARDPNLGQQCRNASGEAGKCGFVKEQFVSVHTNGLPGSAVSMNFSTDAKQSCLYVGDNSNMTIYVLKRDTLEELGRLGRSGREAGEFHWLHQVSVDARGNIYTAEVDTGKRLQKFVRYGEEGCSGTGRTTVGGVLR